MELLVGEVKESSPSRARRIELALWSYYISMINRPSVARAVLQTPL